ncbi:MAG: HNH endonuclease [Alphaproteobacteria bacterium]|nr:MAG: HNH endonuclease [Alphaproteobacteria bacterium]
MRCIFCKQNSSGSRSVEHIIPESIGSKRRILPRGAVCDKCNNYIARKVEQPILNHSWMRNLRAWYQVPNKKGTYPSMLGHIAGSEIPVNMRRHKDGKLQVSIENLSDAHALSQVVAGGFEKSLIFTIEDIPPQREMSRFLCKMAIEAYAELFCSDPNELDRLVDEPYLDNIRGYARYGMNFKSSPVNMRIRNT